MKADAAITTPDAYLKSLPDDRRADVTGLHRAIREAAPALAPHIVYGMLGYGTYRYRYASGKAGEAPVVALASQKNYISLYVSATDDAGYLAEHHAKRLGKVSVGKSCIRFKKLADLNLDVALELVRAAAAMPTERIS